ncbi:hypothetical protein N0V90_008733 [Kalmusia sp. IMI 367209]|nr:hypothetical protein N0V90_008733 [Kalmusia sp. IMI 367209]
MQPLQVQLPQSINISNELIGLRQFKQKRVSGMTTTNEIANAIANTNNDPPTTQPPPSLPASRKEFIDDFSIRLDIIKHLKMLQQFCEDSEDSFDELKTLVNATPSFGNACVFDLQLIEDTIHRSKEIGNLEALAPYQLSHASLGLADIRRRLEGEGFGRVKMMIDVDEYRGWRESWSSENFSISDVAQK